jgi:hypothetical protein
VGWSEYRVGSGRRGDGGTGKWRTAGGEAITAVAKMARTAEEIFMFAVDPRM